MNILPNPFAFISALEPEMVADNGRCPGLTDPPVAAAELYGVGPCMRAFESRFVLDVDAFMNDIEPLPAFLAAPRPEYLDALALRPIVEVLAGHMR